VDDEWQTQIGLIHRLCTCTIDSLRGKFLPRHHITGILQIQHNIAISDICIPPSPIGGTHVLLHNPGLLIILPLKCNINLITIYTRNNGWLYFIAKYEYAFHVIHYA
jgi:hypothetical protein